MFSRLRPWLPLLLATTVAVAFRFPLLDSLPPGLNFDEGGEGVAALDVAQGHFRVMWPIGGGKEPLMAYLVQPFFWIFGPTRLALRLYAALWGVGTVLATYFLARQVLSPHLLPAAQQQSAGRDAEPTSAATIWLPALAAFGVATAFWHVAYSRIAFRALSNPAVEALALGFLWLALRSNRWRDFLWAGFFTGGLAYTYLAGRFVPLGIALFFVAEAIIAWWRGRKALFLQYWPKLVAMVGVALLVFAPLGLFFIQNPGTFGRRGGAVSIFSSEMNRGDFWGTLWQTTLTTVGTFLSLSGDPNALGNIPHRPQLSPLLAVFFVIGLATALARWRKPPYLFLVIWWAVMLLPAILAPEDAPHHLRLIGTAPGTYIFVALGLGRLANLIYTGFARFGRGLAFDKALISWLLLLIVFGLTAFQTYRDYFIRWANDIDHYMAFDIYAEELAAQMAANTDPQLAYAIPMDLRAAHEARHYSLDFLYRGTTPFSYIVVDERQVEQSLTEVAQGRNILRVVRWTRDKHQEADEKGLVTFLLDAGGAVPTDQKPYPAYTVETYRLSGPNLQFAFPPIVTPVDITLDNLIQIRRASVSPRVTGGQNVAVGVTYARIAPTEIDYKASLRLIGPDGVMAGQVDRTLRHNWHQGTSLWPPEEVNEYYLLPLPADAPNGRYEVRVVVYHPETLEPLTMAGLVEVWLGEVMVE